MENFVSMQLFRLCNENSKFLIIFPFGVRKGSEIASKCPLQSFHAGPESYITCFSIIFQKISNFGLIFPFKLLKLTLLSNICIHQEQLNFFEIMMDFAIQTGWRGGSQTEFNDENDCNPLLAIKTNKSDGKCCFYLTFQVMHCKFKFSNNFNYFSFGWRTKSEIASNFHFRAFMQDLQVSLKAFKLLSLKYFNFY